MVTDPMTAPVTRVDHSTAPFGGVQRPDRPGAVGDVGALDHGERAVALDVGEGGAAHGHAVELVAPHLVARGVVHLDGVLVAHAVVEGPGTGGDAVGPAGEDRPDRRRRVDLLVGIGLADEAAVLVVDAEVPTCGVVDPVGLPGRGGAADDEVVLSGPVQVADGRGREDAVGGELRPSGRVGAVQTVLSAYVSWPSDPASTTAPLSATAGDASTPPSGWLSPGGFWTIWFHSSFPPGP